MFVCYGLYDSVRLSVSPILNKIMILIFIKIFVKSIKIIFISLSSLDLLIFKALPPQ